MSDRRAVVIGGGITGVLTAIELRLAGWEVTLLEGAHIGNGSSSRTAAGIRQQFSTPDTVRAMRYAVDVFKRFPELTGQGNVAIRQHGYLFLHAHAQAWTTAKATVDIQRSAGLTEVEVLEGADLQRHFPYTSPDLLGGTYCPTDGFLHPDVIYNDGTIWARSLGVTVVQRARVVSCTTQGTALATVSTADATYGADLFVDATNAWSRRTARVLGAEELPVDPLKRYLWFVARSSAIPRDTFAKMPLVITPDGAYCRPENPDSLLMGKKHDTPAQIMFDDDDQDQTEPGFDHRSGFDAYPYDVWMRIAEAMPPIGEFDGITATTCGYYATTPDHNPFLGFDRWRPNLLRLVGFSGHGAMMGPFTAWAAARLANRGDVSDNLTLPSGDVVSLAPFRIDRTFGHVESMVI